MSKCPYCKKDISYKWFIEEKIISDKKDSRMFYKKLECKHCSNIIFFLFKGCSDEEIKQLENQNKKALILSSPDEDKLKMLLEEEKNGRSLVFSYPFLKTVFNIPGIPSKVKKILNEAELCYSFKSRIGTVACLRTCIYCLCDDRFGKNDEEYTDKIVKLFPEGDEFANLAKQIKWLGDKHLHNDKEDAYNKEDIEQALEIMPMIIREIYGKIDKVNKVKNALNKGYQNSKNP